MRVIRHANLVPAPWKNGGGSTTTIAVEPQGASLDDFDWRISLATIDRDGPFSSFPGIDRSLALVEGGGVELDVAGRRVVLGQDVLEFPGELAVTAKLHGGSTTDFNVMTRRGRYTHRLERRRVAGRVHIGAGGTTIVFVAQGSIDGEGISLQRHDALIIDSVCIVEATEAVLLVTTLMRAP
ncbi:MAG: HutD family protein [Polyangia bacterium]